MSELVTAYFSHSIRGAKGADATDEDVERNCNRAKEVVKWIRENVPGLELYVPAEHEDFVAICWRQKYLCEREILEIDCQILQKRDFHIVLMENGWLGGGIGIEITDAKRTGMLIYYLESLDEVSAAALRVIVGDIALSKELDSI